MYSQPHPLPSQTTPTHQRLYQPPTPSHASTSQHTTPRQYVPRMDPAYPSHGASPQNDYPATPHRNTQYGGAPGSVGSNSAKVSPSNSMAPQYQEQVIVYETAALQGAPGGEFTVKCELSLPPSPPASPNHSPSRGPRDRAIRLVFGAHPVPTTVMPIANPSVPGQLVHLKVQVPGWQDVARAATGNRVPVSIQVMLSGEVVSSTMIGEYAYTSFTSGSRVPSYGNGTNPNPLKRSGEALESHRPSPNHLAHQRLMATGLKYESASPEMGLCQLPQSYASPVMPSDSFASPMPTPWMGGYTQPNLQRSTQIGPVIPIAPYPAPPTTGKANLELTSDLQNMAKGWTTDEWNNRRRLVQFWRKQEGTQITAAFQPLPQDKYSGHTQSIIISCIFREENNTCYVTSVDAIYLLEALVGNRFTVEEKNRIRRNLEGFRPLTISKSKPGSEEFFKLIMSFPNPKPRNIEKDVKVFPWDILSQALKKIIGKYSANYPGSASPAMQHQQLPSYPQMPHPTPLQPADGISHHPYSSDSAPGLVSNDSTDSTTFSQSHPTPANSFDSAPHMMQHHSYPHAHPHSHGSHGLGHPGMHDPGMHGGSSDSPQHFRSNSTPHEKQHVAHAITGHPHAHVHAQGQAYDVSPTSHLPYQSTYYAPPGMEARSPSGGSSQLVPYTLQPMPSYQSEPAHQLPHVHQSSEGRPPSSNDLRVVYPAIAQ